MAEAMTILEIRNAVKAGMFPAELHAQIEGLKKKEGSNAKPFWEMKLRDSSGNLTLRVWSDSPNFRVCESLEESAAVGIEGEFFQNGQYGMDARRWEIRRLSPEEAEGLFAGSAADREEVEANFLFIRSAAGQIADVRLKALCERFLDAFGIRFCRAAAARVNHHARRGGLIAHTAQMMRSALAFAAVYPRLNRDLMVAGVLFHDCGKLWETCPQEAGFSIEYDRRGELMGHISIGVEVVNSLWREVASEAWGAMRPPSDEVRLHLIHLVLAHHGELEFGSPIVPKTPEAIALHYIDNLDARLEMIWQGYETNQEIAPGIHERVRTLNASPVAALGRFEAGALPD